jgi:hypothetical protein
MSLWNDVKMLRMLGTVGMLNFGAPKCFETFEDV